MNDYYKELEEIADRGCNCTSDQMTGKDPSVCTPCQAASVINDIAVQIRDAIEELQ